MSLDRSGLIYSGSLVFPVFVVLIFSYNFHALWLLYDLAAFLLLIHTITSKRISLTPIQVLSTALVLGYFFSLVAFSGEWLYGFLSVWDTFKHLVFILVLSDLNKYGDPVRFEGFSDKLYKVVVFSFLIQLLVVIAQFSIGVRFDDVAGTIGDGGSHAIGYLSLVAIAACLVRSSYLLSVVVIGAAMAMNVASENAGFFVLLFLTLACLLSVSKFSKRLLLLVFLLCLLCVFALSFSPYSNISFGEVVWKRALATFTIPDYFDPAENNGRSAFMFLAYSMGGWFGVGPGAYSNIYLMSGYDNFNLLHQQINITESSHLIAESGVLGFLGAIYLYLLYLMNMFKFFLLRGATCVLFLAAVMYTAVLMNESHVFLLLVLFHFLQFKERVRL